MTDNGTDSGYKNVDGKLYGFNAGMKGTKNSEYEGGHRVPFLISYPDKNISGGKDISELTAHLDILPTLAKLCDIKLPDLKIDGLDISSIILGEEKKINRKYLITDSQRVQAPIKWRKSAVMSDKLRLVNGEELYNIANDPAQKIDIAKQYPEIVNKMRGFYEEWWNSISTEFNLFPVIILGSDNQNPIELSCHDTHILDSKIPWNQDYIKEADKNPYGGNFTVEFERSGKYRVEISRWPFESGLSINEAVKGRQKTISTEAISDGKAMGFIKGGIQIGAWVEEKEVVSNSKSIIFEGNFTKGKTDMTAWFTNADNVNWGAFYIKVTRL